MPVSRNMAKSVRHGDGDRGRKKGSLLVIFMPCHAMPCSFSTPSHFLLINGYLPCSHSHILEIGDDKEVVPFLGCMQGMTTSTCVLPLLFPFSSHPPASKCKISVSVAIFFFLRWADGK